MLNFIWFHPMLTIVGFFVVVGLVALLLTIPQVRRMEKARKEYWDALQRLKLAPNDPDQRERTLYLGRVFSDSTCDSHGRRSFDELALMNDINAACARATIGHGTVARVEVTNTGTVNGRSVAQEIERLGQLRIAGVITDEEFERGKALFLGAPPDKAASAVELLQNLDALKKQGVLSQSEFNMKKWEVLSERLIPGKLQAAKMPRQPAPVADHIVVSCPTCESSVKVPPLSGRFTCPYCRQSAAIG